MAPNDSREDRLSELERRLESIRIDAERRIKALEDEVRRMREVLDQAVSAAVSDHKLAGRRRKKSTPAEPA